MDKAVNQLWDEVVFTPVVRNYTLNSISGGVGEDFGSKSNKHFCFWWKGTVGSPIAVLFPWC